MLINGIQLSSLGASLHNRVLSSNKVKTKQNWTDGSAEPTFIRQQDSFKNITLQFLITEQNEENAFILMSNITMLLRKAVIIFNDMPNLQFDVTMKGDAKQERLMNGNFILTVDLQSDYAKGSSEIYTTNTAATDSFNLTVVYYKDQTQLVATETVKIKASDFDGKSAITLADLGIDINKHQEDHYNKGVVTNFKGLTLDYNTLRSLGILIINYAATVYTKAVEYYLYNGSGYDLVETVSASFTYEKVANSTTIGQIIDLNRNRPSGYKAVCRFDLDFTFDNIMKFPTALPVYIDVIENERTKDVTVTYMREVDNGYSTIATQTIVVRESDVVDGTTINKIIQLDNHKPNDFYASGYCVELDNDTLITFDILGTEYSVKYDLIESTVYVEYYKGEYPDWSRSYTDTLKLKYKDSYDGAEDIIESLGIVLNKYKTDLYNDGIVFNKSVYTDYETVLNIGVIQIYYVPKEYQITVNYKQDVDGDIVQVGTKDYTLTDLLFLAEPRLANLIDINLYRNDGYNYDETRSYDGEITLSALTAASPITIMYTATTVVRTKSIVIKYKKQLANTYSTINTSVVTVEEAAVGGGIKLKDIFEVNKYRPEYYDEGIIDGFSSDALVTFEEINGNYDVYYFASTYSTQIRYYTDEVDINNWIGSSRISYTVLSFENETTIVTLGADINQFKPPYCDDGEIQPFGPTNFSTLVNLEAINIVYMSKEEPGGDDGIDYPHRILFLQHNDMGSFDKTFPTWTLNHAYINTGVVADDISKTTVAMSTVRVFEDQPLYNVNVGYAYLFGAISPRGSMYIRYENNTNYTSNPTGKNYFRGMAGDSTPSLVIEEESSNGFSRNTGIYSSDRDGYSYMTLTYSNLIQSNAGNTLVPLYLFACDYNGNYTGGIAGVGITGCKIYKDGVLVRDYIPVQYYDLIGTKVAPSNCLYDKVTQTFFEDARKMNSFNIIDDDEYEDTNPLHNIGKCFVNYYKDGGFFQNRVIYFREADFINDKVWDVDEQLAIDQYQPQFYGAGEITNIDQLGGVTFNNVNNFVFEVNYPSTGYYVNVNYYKDSINQNNLLASEQVYLTEDKFYQVPTFGQLIPLLKYRPEGYELKQENIPYTQTKVTLTRLLQAQPFDIVYTELEEDPASKVIRVKYYKHKNWIEPKNPLNQYDYIGYQDITINSNEVIDGVYPETFMSFNAYKPQGEENYWSDGQPFEWYVEDENLTSLDELRDEYIIVYEPIMQYINVKYYTDEVDPDDFNLVASDTWAIKINDWNFGEEFQIVDELPNSYINKFKPGNCNAGILQNPDTYYTFNSLCEQGHIDIVYMTKEEPHDPDDDSFPDKVLFWYKDKTTSELTDGEVNMGQQHSRAWQLHNGFGYPRDGEGACIPYLNLGYTPKEIGRLSIQAKAYSVADSCWNGGGMSYAPTVDDYTYFFGYMGAAKPEDIVSATGYDNAKQALFGTLGKGMHYNMYSRYSSQSNGWIAMRGHIPETGGFTKQSRRPWSVDGNDAMKWSNEAQLFSMYWTGFLENNRTMGGGFRLGAFSSIDENLEVFNENQDHVYFVKTRNGDNPVYEDSLGKHQACSWSNAFDYIWKGIQFSLGIPETYTGPDGPTDLDNWEEFEPAVFFHPVTMTIDAYNRYVEIYDISNDQNPTFYNVDVSKDYDLFTDRGKPKGPIRLFVTTNPDTGEPNIIPGSIPVWGFIKNYVIDITTIRDTAQGKTDEDGNYISVDDKEGIAEVNQPGLPYESHGGLLEMAYNPYYLAANDKTGLNCPWVNFRYNAAPSLLRTAVWNAKVWDRGKLVRDLIPVAKGDQIFDYVAPDNGMFDKITEIFFTNANQGGTYKMSTGSGLTGQYNSTRTITADQVQTFRVMPDPTQYGKIVVNYYDYDNTFLGNKWVKVPTDYFADNISFKDLLAFNDYKPSIYYHDGILDTDTWLETDVPLRTRLKQLWDAGSVNVYYKQKQYTKTVVYYNENTRIASKDFFFSQAEIEAASSLADLGIEPDLYRSADFKPGVVMSDETIIASDDVAAFIDAPSPVVVYHKYTKEERPDLFYVEYYRGGAYEEEGQETITLNSENKNYLDCDLTAVVLNPKGLIKYVNHYHSALYEDEEMPYFIAYQVDVTANYVPVHKGPARAYTLLGHITDRGRYTVIEERNGWGRLKEYPKGWILLKYTQPITGPGQNPDYDDSDLANVTIPFGTRLSVTKMTIDRLWAYTPEYGSWIKTEEISYDQGGRLYNALALKVLHLDSFDWSEIETLADLGINVQQYKLRFHEDSDYQYTGEYTQAAFSDLHSIDIVYPETIYPYVVKYYKDIIDEDNVIGRGAFSCSLSDWNPDWDTFLTTSYLRGYDGKISTVSEFYRTVGKTETLTIAEDEEVYILSIPTIYRDISCYYVMWGGYVGYVPVSSVTVVDDTIHTISPILYRSGQPLMLDWSFYNLDRNLYKPDASYTDGIMLWNPHTYDNKVLNFSFEELITTGSQKVLYVPAVDLDYEMKFTRGWMKLPTGMSHFVLAPTDEEPGIWDIEIKYKSKVGDNQLPYHQKVMEANATGEITRGGLYAGTDYPDHTDYRREGLVAISDYGNVSTNDNKPWAWPEINDYYSYQQNGRGYNGCNKYYTCKYFDGVANGSYYNIVNFSNKRPYKKATAQRYGNLAWDSEAFFTPRVKDFYIIEDSEYRTYSDFNNDIDMSYLSIGCGGYFHAASSGLGSNWTEAIGESRFSYIKVWQNYELIHYYVPLPQGYWLPNGEQLQQNSFYDLVTQNVEHEILNYPDVVAPVVVPKGGDDEYGYFANWQFDTENVNYIVKVKENVKAYQYPDALSRELGTLEKNSTFPVYVMTQDEANHVVGTWYKTGPGWIKAQDCNIIQYEYPMSEYYKLVALKGDESNTVKSYYGYRKPDTVVDSLTSDYIYFENHRETVDTGLDLNQIGKMEVVVSGSLAPSATSNQNGIINAVNSIWVIADDLNASTTQTDLQYTITLVNTTSPADYDIYVNGNKIKSFVCPNTTGRMYIGSRSQIKRTPESSWGYMYTKPYVNYHSVKIWDKNNTLIKEFVPELIITSIKGDKITAYKIQLKCIDYSQGTTSYVYRNYHTSYEDRNYIYFEGDTRAVDNFTNPQTLINFFTTEKTERVYYSSNDFYWNGWLWIPASYTDDFKVMWDSTKTYVVQVNNIYSHSRPIEESAYRVSNYLAGDRVRAIGNLGKDENWYILENGNWIFNNNTLNLLEE